MNKIVSAATGVGVAIIIGVIIFQISGTLWEQVSVDEYYEKAGKVPGVVYPDNPQLLGPLQINKDKYLLGENVYVMLKNLQPGDKGQVNFYTPGGKLYEEWKFNGDERDFQKKYFKPSLLKSKNLCDKNELIGEWTVMFQGYNEMTLNFEIVEEILPNQEYQYEECNIAYEFNLQP